MQLKLIQKDAQWTKVASKSLVKRIQYLLSTPITFRDKKGKLRFGKKSLLDGRGNKFPTGLVPYVIQHLYNAKVNVDFYALKYKKLPVRIPSLPNIKFEKYQKKILRKVTSENNRGVLIAPTGAGKSLIIGGVIDKFKCPCTLIIATKETVFSQLLADLEKWFPEYTIGAIGDSKCELGHITVALYQSLSKWNLKNYNRLVDLIIMDEVQEINNSIVSILNQLDRCHYRYGLTATMPRPDDDPKEKEKYLNVIGNFGPVLSEITDEECYERVTKVEIYTLKTVITNMKASKYQESFRKDVLLNKKRCKNIIYAAEELFLNKDKTCAILLDEVKHAQALKKTAESMGYDLTLVHGKNPKQLNRDIKKLIEEGEKKFICATGTWGTGFSVYNIYGIILASARKSYTKVIQNIGRGRRRIKGKKDLLTVVDMVDIVIGDKKFHRYFKEYGDLRIRWYKEKGWYKGNLKLKRRTHGKKNKSKQNISFKSKKNTTQSSKFTRKRIRTK